MSEAQMIVDARSNGHGIFTYILSSFHFGNPNIGLSPILHPCLIEILTLAWGADCKGQQWIILFLLNTSGELTGDRGNVPSDVRLFQYPRLNNPYKVGHSHQMF